MTDRVRVRVKHAQYEVEAEGESTFVERYVAAELGTWSAPNSDPGAEVGGNATKEKVISVGSGVGARLKDFLTLRAAKGHPEVAAVLAYWAKANEGVTDLSGAELEDLYRRAGLKRPALPVNVMAKAASSYGWFKNVGGGKYALTSTGEDHVLLELP